MKNSNTLLPSFESVDEAADLALGHTDEFDYSSSEADQYAHEQNVFGRELDRQQDLVEGGTQDLASLESLANAIDEARELGMEMGSAQFMHIHLNNVQTRYGINEIETAAPSMECFQERRARIATSASLESVKETAQKVWAWIKEQFAKFIEMMKKFYHELTKSLDFIHAEADKVKNTARRLKFEGGAKIDLGRTARKICYEGKLTKDYQTHFQTMLKLTRVSEETFKRIRQEVLDGIAGGKNTNFDREVPIPAGFIVVRQGQGFSFNPDEAVNVHASPLLPGDRHVLVQTFYDENRPSTMTSEQNPVSIQGRVFTVHSDEHKLDDTTIEALSSQEVFQLCQGVQQTVNGLKKERDAMLNHMEETRRKIDDHFAQLADEAGVGGTLQKMASWHMKRITLYGGPLHRHCEKVAFDVLTGYLSYAKRSIAHAEEQSAKPKFEVGHARLAHG